MLPMFDTLLTKCQWRIEALRQLHSFAELQLACRIFLIAVLVPFLVRWRLLRAFQRRAHHHTKRHTPSAQSVERTVTLTDLILRVGQPILQNRCLVRTLTLYYLLRRAGVMVDLQIGLASAEHGYAAHSWLVKDGLPFAERVEPNRYFRTMYRL